MGRVTVANYDGDRQLASAKIARLAPGPAGAIVQVIAGDDLKRGIPGNSDFCFYLQTVVVTESEWETFILECGTYDGEASWASLQALKVDAVKGP